jgi:hypothetical protein
MAKSTAKAKSLVRQLKDILKMRTAAGIRQLGAAIDEVREQEDANAWPMLFVSNGNEAAAQPVVAVRISGTDAVSKDVLGNSLTAFAPHLAEVAFEDAVAANSIIKDAVVSELSKMGLRIQIKRIAAATAVTEASMNAASAELDIEDVQWPTKST